MPQPAEQEPAKPKEEILLVAGKKTQGARTDILSIVDKMSEET